MSPRRVYFQSQRDIISRLAGWSDEELLKQKRLYELRGTVKHNKYYYAVIRELKRRGVQLEPRVET